MTSSSRSSKSILAQEAWDCGACAAWQLGLRFLQTQEWNVYCCVASLVCLTELKAVLKHCELPKNTASTAADCEHYGGQPVSYVSYAFMSFISFYIILYKNKGLKRVTSTSQGQMMRCLYKQGLFLRWDGQSSLPEVARV